MPRIVPTSAFAALSLSITELDDGAMLLIPAGEFRSYDGRPAECPAWRMTAQSAQRVIDERRARGTAVVIDWEHATLHRGKAGHEAPAAGWINPDDLAWREGVGLVGLRREWTPRAAAQVESQEYRYGSPVFRYNKTTGEVLSLHSFALTNDPGLDGIAVALSALSPDQPVTETSPMIDDLLEQIRWLLNLPTLATPEEVAAELSKAVAQIKASAGTAAATFDLLGTIKQAQSAVAALSAAPDPAMYAPVSTLVALQAELADLRLHKLEADVSSLVNEGEAAGKIIPATRAWAVELGKSNLAALQGFLGTAPVVVPALQSGGKEPDISGAKGKLSESELAVCSAMGISVDDFIKDKETK